MGGLFDSDLILIDANALHPVNALEPMDVRLTKSKLVKPVQPSNEPSPIVDTFEIWAASVSATQPLKLPLPMDVTLEKSKLFKAVQPRKAVSLIKYSVCGRDSVVSFSQPSKQE